MIGECIECGETEPLFRDYGDPPYEPPEIACLCRQCQKNRIEEEIENLESEISHLRDLLEDERGNSE